jgi:zinc resistance-associated protein
MKTLRKVALSAAILAFGGDAAMAQSNAPAVNAQQQPPSTMSASPGGAGSAAGTTSEDRSAFADAFVAGRLAEAKALLKPTPDQEKLWAPLDSAIRDAVRARMTHLRNMVEQRRSGDSKTLDPIQRLTQAADRAAQRADALKRILAAAQPLYASLSDDQKRTIAVARQFRHFRFDREVDAFGMGREPDHDRVMGRYAGDDDHEDWRREMDRSREPRYGRNDEDDWGGGTRRGWRREQDDDHDDWRPRMAPRRHGEAGDDDDDRSAPDE